MIFKSRYSRRPLDQTQFQLPLPPPTGSRLHYNQSLKLHHRKQMFVVNLDLQAASGDLKGQFTSA